MTTKKIEAGVFKEVESLCGVVRLAMGQAIAFAHSITDADLRSDAVVTLQETFEELLQQFKGKPQLTAIPPVIMYRDESYVDVGTYITFGDKEWKFTETLEIETGKISQGPLEVADAPDGAFDGSISEPPKEVTEAYGKLQGKALDLLEDIKETDHVAS